MWYGAGTHLKPLREHRKAGASSNAALQCDASESEMTAMPLKPGGAGLHAGRTLHYSRGNVTDGPRRAYILNFRPRVAIEFERAHGFDHGRAGNKSHAVRTTAADDAEAHTDVHAGGAGAGSGSEGASTPAAAAAGGSTAV